MYGIRHVIYPDESEVFCITRLEDGAVIPYDINNVDYQDYLDWVAVGNTPATIAE